MHRTGLVSTVIFDIDGTLVDSTEPHARAWHEALRHFGKDVPFEKVRNQIGKGTDQTLPVFLSHDEIEEFGAKLDKFKSNLYRTQYMKTVRPFPKVRELLERIRHDGRKIALATSAGAEELRFNRSILHVDDLVDACTSELDAKRTKPFPDVFIAALQKLGDPPPDTVLVVGDSPYDAEAAGHIPLATIGVLCGGFSETQLRQAGCIAIYKDPGDLLARYDKSPLRIA